MRFQTIATLFVALGLWVLNAIAAPAAFALTAIKLSDINYKECPPEYAEGMVTSWGNTVPAVCYLIVGQANNPSGKPIYDADVFGRIYDANNDPVMQNRTRIGIIDEVPPGKSQFELRITVPANQPTPLKLEQFKASGFAGRVRPSFDDLTDDLSAL
jgi:hypothetical protein